MTAQNTFAEASETILNSAVTFEQLAQAWAVHIPEVTAELLYSDFEGGDGSNEATEALFETLELRYGIREFGSIMQDGLSFSAIYAAIYAVGLMTAQDIRQHLPEDMADKVLSATPL